jgi:hypothetical protein
MEVDDSLRRRITIEEFITRLKAVNFEEENGQLFEATIYELSLHIKVKATTARRHLLQFVVFIAASIQPLDTAGIPFIRQ